MNNSKKLRATAEQIAFNRARMMVHWVESTNTRLFKYEINASFDSLSLQAWWDAARAISKARRK